MLYFKRLPSYGFAFAVSAFCCAMACFAATFLNVKKDKNSTLNASRVSASTHAYPTACGTTTVISKCAASALLEAESGQTNYLWSTGATTSSITVTTSGLYWWETSDLTNNKVTNGDFSNSNTGITSQYTYVAPTGNTVLYPEGYYTIINNPKSAHSGFSAFFDHTLNTASGRMMVVNGATTAGITIWQQSVTIVPNTDYIFSVWFTSVHPSNPGKLNFSINGTALGTPIILSSGTPDWTKFSVRWNSGSSTSAIIGIVNQNTAQTGNDFALDDIVFAPVCRNYFDVTLRSNPPKPIITPF